MVGRPEARDVARRPDRHLGPAIGVGPADGEALGQIGLGLEEPGEVQAHPAPGFAARAPLVEGAIEPIDVRGGDGVAHVESLGHVPRGEVGGDRVQVVADQGIHRLADDRGPLLMRVEEDGMPDDPEQGLEGVGMARVLLGELPHLRPVVGPARGRRLVGFHALHVRTDLVGDLLRRFSPRPGRRRRATGSSRASGRVGTGRGRYLGRFLDGRRRRGSRAWGGRSKRTCGTSPNSLMTRA